jgi:hypothetical protein
MRFGRHFGPLIVAALLACACRARERTTAATPAPDDAAVYAVVLDSLFTNSAGGAPRRLIVSDSTTSYPRDEVVPEFWAEFLTASHGDSVLVSNFQSTSQHRHALHSVATELRQRLRSPIDFVADTALRQVQVRADSLGRTQPDYPRLADGFWRAFYERFPRSFGATRISAVAYDRTGEKALVYVEHGCGGLCGEGKIVLLQLEGGTWRIRNMTMTWVS